MSPKCTYQGPYQKGEEGGFRQKRKRLHVRSRESERENTKLVVLNVQEGDVSEGMQDLQL